MGKAQMKFGPSAKEKDHGTKEYPSNGEDVLALKQWNFMIKTLPLPRC